MKSLLPHSAEPTGAPSPLLKHTETLSNRLAMRRASLRASLPGPAACATAALNRRAPSRCVASPFARASAVGLLQVLERQHLATQRVLQRQQPGAREVRVVRLDRRFDVGKGQRAVGLVVQRLRLHAAEHRRAAAFPAIAVLHLADDVLVAALAMRQHAAQVALRAGRHEQRRLEPEQRRDLLLQRVDARVVAEHVVAQRRCRHRGAHGRRWAG